jgi:hypothetical protein
MDSSTPVSWPELSSLLGRELFEEIFEQYETRLPLRKCFPKLEDLHLESWTIYAGTEQDINCDLFPMRKCAGEWPRIINGLLIVEDPEPAPRWPNKLMCANRTH